MAATMGAKFGWSATTRLGFLPAACQAAAAKLRFERPNPATGISCESIRTLDAFA